MNKYHRERDRQRQKEVGERGGRERDEQNQRETENVVGGKVDS